MIGTLTTVYADLTGGDKDSFDGNAALVGRTSKTRQRNIIVPWGPNGLSNC